MTHLRLVYAEQRHLATFMPDIRPLDNEEWVAGTGMSTRAGLHAVITVHPNSSWAVVGNNEDCWALWGVTPPVQRFVEFRGVAWMVASKKAQRNLHAMHRLFNQGISDMHKLYPHLEAWAYAPNTLHHRWMERFGWQRTGKVRSFALPGFGFVQFHRSREVTPSADYHYYGGHA